jgi:acyl-CoA synthetase (AMP-forming)/AMP-acid ligase II
VDLRAVAPPSPSPVPAGLLDEAETLTGALARLAERFPDFTCLTILGRDRSETRLTLRELWTRACSMQAAFAEAGVRRGDFVVLVLPTGPDLLAAYFGAMLATGVPTLLAPPSNRFAAPEVYRERLAFLLDHTAARALVCEDEVAALLGASRATVLTPARIRRPATLPRPVPIASDVVATAQYSSGSTGTPKGVLLSHHAVLNNVRATRAGLALTPADVTVNWLPLYHDLGLIDAFLLPILAGSPSILIPTMDFMRVPSMWLWALHHYRGTVSLSPNFAYALAAQRITDDELVGLDLRAWRVAFNGSEPVLATTLAAFAGRFAPYGVRPTALVSGWGLAESVCISTIHPLGEAVRVETIDRQALATASVATPTAGDGLASVSVGTALPGVEIAIRDEHRAPLPERHVGTIWLRTTSLFHGYHRDPGGTAKTLVDGWLDTGDQGYLADRHLYFVAREKDLIVIGGEKYAPHDVETAIGQVPGVRAGCAVAFGVLDAGRGTEELAAVVETRETDAEAQTTLAAAIRAAVMRDTGLGLRHVVLVPPGGVEKTTSGKLARRATRARWAHAIDG